LADLYPARFQAAMRLQKITNMKVLSTHFKAQGLRIKISAWRNFRDMSSLNGGLKSSKRGRKGLRTLWSWDRLAQPRREKSWLSKVFRKSRRRGRLCLRDLIWTTILRGLSNIEKTVSCWFRPPRRTTTGQE
jgi:hypothetical protein